MAHEHLRRLVDANTADQGNLVDQFHVLAGTRSRLPSLEEATETMSAGRIDEWADVAKMSDEDLWKNYKIGKEREDALMGQPLKFFNSIKEEMKKRKMKVEAFSPAVTEAVSGSAPSIPDLHKWQTKIVGKGVVSRTIALQGKVVNVIERGEPKGSGLYRYTLYIDGKKIGKQDFTDTKDMFKTIQHATVESVETDEDMNETSSGVYFVLVDVSKPGGKLVSKKVFQGLPGLKKADAVVEKLRAKGRNIQVIDAAWYVPADPLVAALKKEEGTERGVSLLKRSRGTIDEGQPYDPEEDPRRFSDKMLYDFMDMTAEIGGEERIKLSKAAYKKYSAALREMKNRKLPTRRPPTSDFDSNGAYMKAIPGAKGGVRPKGEAADDLGEAKITKGQTIKVGEDSYKVLRVYPTKADADGPLPTDLLRLIKKGGGAVLVDLQPGGDYKVKGDMLVSPDSSKPRYYVLATKEGGAPDGYPVSLKPAQYKRVMSYQYGEAVEPVVEAGDTMKKIAGLMFAVIDMRGQKGFPDSEEGLVYHLKVEYKLKDKYTGREKPWKSQYVIRTDHRNQGWRVDEMEPPMPAVAVPGIEGYYKSPTIAAKKLAAYLKDIQDKGIYVESATSAGARPMTEEVQEFRVMAGLDPLPRRLVTSHPVTEALSAATVRAFCTVLSSKLTQYDKRLSARERMPNIYRLGHLLGASQRVEDRVKNVMDQSTPEALKALESAMDREFTPNFSPVNAVKKQIAAFLASGKMPTLK